MGLTGFNKRRREAALAAEKAKSTVSPQPQKVEDISKISNNTTSRTENIDTPIVKEDVLFEDVKTPIKRKAVSNDYKNQKK